MEYKKDATIDIFLPIIVSKKVKTYCVKGKTSRKHPPPVRRQGEEETRSQRTFCIFPESEKISPARPLSHMFQRAHAFWSKKTFIR